MLIRIDIPELGGIECLQLCLLRSQLAFLSNRRYRNVMTNETSRECRRSIVRGFGGNFKFAPLAPSARATASARAAPSPKLRKATNAKQSNEIQRIVRTTTSKHRRRSLTACLVRAPDTTQQSTSHGADAERLLVSLVVLPVCNARVCHVDKRMCCEHFFLQLKTPNTRELVESNTIEQEYVFGLLVQATPYRDAMPFFEFANQSSITTRSLGG